MAVSPWLAAVIVLVLVWASYANSLRNGFVWDDKIILSRQLVVFDSLRAVLVTPRDIPQYSPDYYRPLTIASFLLDRAIGDDQPFAYHLSVVGAHTVVSLLVLALGWILFGIESGGRIAAVVAAALFAVHPIHTESVAWIAGRSDVLATCFLLAALVADLRLSHTWGRAVAVGVLSLLALAAKETAISVIPLLVLCDICVSSGRDARRSQWPVYAAVAVAGMLYLALRNASVGGIIGEATTTSPVDRSVVDLVGAVGAYLLKLMWPARLNAYIDVVPVHAMALVLTLAAATALVGLAVWAWMHRRRVVTFLIVWLALTLAPSLAVVWRIPEAPMAERYLYLPSVAFCLLCGVGVSLLWQLWTAPEWRRAVATAVGAIVLAGSAATWARNQVWLDDLTLWTDTAAKSRIAGLPLRSLGVAYLQRGQTEAARRYLEQALQRRNGPAGMQVIHNNLGTIEMQAQRYEQARQHYEAALQAYPGGADTLFNLGLSILQGGGASRDAANAALDYFRRAEQLSPHDADIQAALGQVAAIRGDREQAIAYLQRALALEPSPPVAHNIRAYLAKLEQSTPQ